MLRWNVKWCFSDMQKGEIGLALSGYSSTHPAIGGITAIFRLRHNKAEWSACVLDKPSQCFTACGRRTTHCTVRQCSIVWIVWSRSDNPVSLTILFVHFSLLTCTFLLHFFVWVGQVSHINLPFPPCVILAIVLNCFIFIVIKERLFWFALVSFNTITMVSDSPW